MVDIAGLVRFGVLEFFVCVVAYHAHKKGSLTLAGNAWAWWLGTILAFADGAALVALITFFGVANVATRYRASLNQSAQEKHETRRSARQVLANGSICVIASLMHYHRTSRETETDPSWAAIAAVATALGDTLASELAPVFTSQRPRLVTNWKRFVDRGENGGVTVIGVFLSMVGGWIAGLAYGLAFGHSVIDCVVWGGAFGAFGSLLDSVLGATLEGGKVAGSNAEQYGWRWLDNDAVNFLATAGAAALAWCYAPTLAF